MNSKVLIIIGVIALSRLTSFGQEPTISFHNDYPIFGPDGTPLAGTNYRAQLFVGPGAGVPDSGMIAQVPITNFRTGSKAGFINPVTVTPFGVPPDVPVWTIEIRVWDDSGGMYPDWSTADPAWRGGVIAAGVSLSVNWDPFILSPKDPFQYIPAFS